MEKERMIQIAKFSPASFLMRSTMAGVRREEHSISNSRTARLSSTIFEALRDDRMEAGVRDCTDRFRPAMQKLQQNLFISASSLRSGRHWPA